MLIIDICRMLACFLIPHINFKMKSYYNPDILVHIIIFEFDNIKIDGLHCY
jgi:hypothetical protein